MRLFRAVIASIAALLLLANLVQAADGRRPNVFLIYVDDLDFDEIAATGGHVLTPRLDRLADEGLRFDRAYITAPVCTPSRYSLLTGRHAGRSPALQPTDDQPYNIRWNTLLRPGEVTIAELLSRHGYRTGMVGKWHLGLKPGSRYLAGHGLGNADPEDPAVRDLMWRLYAEQRDYVAQTFGFDFVGALHLTNPEAYRDSGDLPEELAIHNVDWMTDRALAFLAADDDHPFFLYYATTVPHGPSAVRSMHSDPRFTMAGVLEEPPRGLPPRDDMFRRILLAGLAEPRPWQFMGMTWLDDSVGAILDRLDAMGELHRTLVVVMSDNRSDGKFTIYEDGARVPCFLWWPDRILQGSSRSELVANIDVAATLADVCGVTVPADIEFDGMSWVPLLEESTVPWRQDLLLEIGHARGLVTADAKYIAVRHPAPLRAVAQPLSWDGRREVLYDAASRHPAYFDLDQLYDLRVDPNELVNLVDDPRHRDRITDLRARLADHLRSFDRPFAEFTR